MANDFPIDTLKNITTDEFYGNEPVIVYSTNICVIIALNQESKKNVIAKLKPDKKMNKEKLVFKEFVLEHNKYINYINNDEVNKIYSIDIIKEGSLKK